MPKTVVLWDGTVTSVPDDVANRLSQDGTHGRLEGQAEGLDRVHADNEGDRHTFNWTDEFKSAAETALTGGIAGGFSPYTSSDWQQQVGEGARDIVTGGLAGRASDALAGDEGAYTNRAIRQAHTTARTVGEIGGAIATGGLLPTGELGGAAKLAARGLEGASFGVNSHLAEANVTGDPLTVEGTIEAAGTGAIMNLAFGFAGDALGAGVSKAAGYVQKASEARGVFDAAEEGGKLFKDEATKAAYDSFADAHDAGVQSAEKFNRAVDKSQKAWTEWTSGPEEANKALKQLDGVQNELRARQQAAISDVHAANIADQTANRTANIVGGAVKPMMIRPPAAADIEAAAAPFRELSDGIKQGTDEVRALLKSGEYEAAAQRIQALTKGIRETPDFADISLPDVPSAPPDPLPVSGVKLPESLEKFARMTDGKINELGNGLKDPAAVGAFQRLADQLGVRADSTPELVAGVQGKLKGYTKAIDQIAELAQEEGSSSGLVPILKKAFRRGMYRFGAGMVGGVLGGPVGAAAGFVMSEAAGSIVNGAEKSLLDATMMSGKVGVREKIANLIMNLEPAAKGGLRVGNSLDILKTSLWTGAPDPRAGVKQARELARDRMNEIAAATQTGPDALFQTLRPLIGHSSDIAYKAADHMMRALNYLFTTSPKDPGTDRKGFQSNWLPSHADTLALAARLEAFLQPLTAAGKALTGSLHPAGAEALKTMWPSMMGEIGGEAMFQDHAVGDASYPALKGYSQLLGANMSGLANPAITNLLQGNYLPKPSQSSPVKQKRAPGRPAAIQSSVAGTSPGNLIAGESVDSQHLD